MAKCIYCQKTESETTFSLKKGEHVMSQLLGRFDLYFGDDLVCQKCNSEISKAETVFKEGSLAGIHSAIYGIDDTISSIRIRKDKISWTISSDTGELGVFQEVFPFVRLTESNIYPKSIIILDHKDSKIKYILFVEKYALYAKNKKAKEFQNRKEHIRKLKERFKKLDISLFGDTNKGWTIEKIVALLRDYGLDYNKKSEEKFEDSTRGERWVVNYIENGDKETLRTPAKIAFNYFSFCAKKSNLAGILQGSAFDNIRQYIRYGKLPPAAYKPAFRYNPNPEDRKGLHIITFQKENKFITSFVSLFSRFNYKIVIAEYPFNTQYNNFGCATAFDPFQKTIINTIYSKPLPIIGKQNFGLFCR